MSSLFNNYVGVIILIDVCVCIISANIKYVQNSYTIRRKKKNTHGMITFTPKVDEQYTVYVMIIDPADTKLSTHL